MFLCHVTKRPSKPRDPMTKIVVERREVTYTNYVDGEAIESKGFETVREIQVCPEGLVILKGERPDLFVAPDELPEERVWRKRPIEDDDDSYEYAWGI